MKKHLMLMLLAVICCAGKSFAQAQKPCATDEVRARMVAEHPEILKYEAELESQIKNGLSKIDFSKAAKTTMDDQSGNADFWYDVPIVIHLIHNFGSEYLTDDQIFNDVKDWNIVYSKQNPDTTTVIATFRPYIGNLHIRLRLATKDPNGNPTKGITRHRSYLTYFGGDQGKMDDWPNNSYVNIWVVNTMSVTNFEAAAYATPPSSAAVNPVGDGIICLADYMADAYDGMPNAISKTIPHEMGHIFNLSHTWGGTNSPNVACGDDGVDDTPPTKGHDLGGCSNAALYDTICAKNYFKIYTAADGHDSVVNYPDTANSQNIMDYTYCARMFTKGQAARMHAALNNTIGGRNNLWDTANLKITGALAPMPDLQPIPDFWASNLSGIVTGGNYPNAMNYFTFPNYLIRFNSTSYNDTITSLHWTFSNNAQKPTSDSLGHDLNSFGDPGWVSLSMSAMGNNQTAANTVTWPRAVFVADADATPGPGYVQNFNGADTAKWPMFNYYNNEFKWQYANVGYDDNSCIQYAGYDNRIDFLHSIFPLTGSPLGDFDDIFSIPIDLSSYSGKCYLNFYYSGASRSSRAYDINDELDIDYAIKSTGSTLNWINISKITKGNLCNQGSVFTPYTPTKPSDWAPMAITVPDQAKTPYTVFRFRYKPSVSFGYDPSKMTYTLLSGIFSSGNNFYLDKINFSPWPAAVANVNLDNMDVAVVPNPTNGDAYVVIKDASYTTAKIVVTDITGKAVYTTSQEIIGNEAHIVIPQSAIAVKGMYLVQATTGNQSCSRKLVVY